jgi:hypothetical protein
MRSHRDLKRIPPLLRRLCALLVGLSFGCSTESEPPECSMAPPYPKVQASCARLKTDPTTHFPEYDTAFSGTVVGFGAAGRPEGCFEPASNGFSLELETSTGETWIVAMSQIALQKSFAIGDALEVVARRQGGSFQHREGMTRLEIRRDAKLVVYLEASGTLETLSPPPEVSLSAEEGCRVNTSCYEWAARPLRVRANEAKATVPYASTVEIGEYTVLGVFAEQRSGTRCADAAIGYAAVTVSLTAASPP